MIYLCGDLTGLFSLGPVLFSDQVRYVNQKVQLPEPHRWLILAVCTNVLTKPAATLSRRCCV